MSTRDRDREQRKLRSIARKYERDGYSVTIPSRGGAIPDFLKGLQPDLIAESEHDRVVVEVKRSDAARGSNELLEMAERVSRESAWRFELVTVPADQQASVPSAEHMDAIATRARQAMDIGLTDVAYLFAYSAMEDMLNDLAQQHGMKVARAPFALIVRELLAKGIISRESFELIERARAARNRLIHSERDIQVSVQDVEALLTFGQHLRSEIAGVISREQRSSLQNS